MIVHIVRCVECGRRFDDIDAYDLHIQSTPHQIDAVQVIMERYLAIRREDVQ